MLKCWCWSQKLSLCTKEKAEQRAYAPELTKEDGIRKGGGGWVVSITSCGDVASGAANSPPEHTNHMSLSLILI